VPPPWKNPSDAQAYNKHVKLHHFCKNYGCISPSGNTVQQHQCGKQAIAGWQTLHGVFCQTITKSCQIANNILQIILTKYCQNSTTFFSLNDLLQQWTQYQLLYLNLFRQNSKFKSGGPVPTEIKLGRPRPLRGPGSATHARL